MKHDRPYTRRLRQSKKSAFTALFAMLFQFLFAMEHASAMAVAASKGGADGSAKGILEICTARGLLRIPAPAGSGIDEKQAPRSSGGESCAVCGSTAVSGTTETPASALIATAPHVLTVAIIPPATLEQDSTGFKRSGTTRGPPPESSMTF